MHSVKPAKDKPHRNFVFPLTPLYNIVIHQHLFRYPIERWLFLNTENKNYLLNNLMTNLMGN